MKNLDQPRPFETIPEIVDYYKRKLMTVPNKTSLSEQEQECMLHEIEGMVVVFNTELMSLVTMVIKENHDQELREKLITDIVSNRDRKLKDLMDYNKLILKR